MILLDTYALLWAVNDPRRLSRAAYEAIQSAVAQGGLAISGITLWELSCLIAHGALEIAQAPEDFLNKISSHTAVLPITAKIAALAYQLPEEYPSDPADRLIGATAWASAIPLITKDRAIRASATFKTIW
jgi:PIN domain nuclease of toxin-antitoxin system